MISLEQFLTVVDPLGGGWRETSFLLNPKLVVAEDSTRVTAVIPRGASFESIWSTLSADPVASQADVLSVRFGSLKKNEGLSCFRDGHVFNGCVPPPPPPSFERTSEEAAEEVAEDHKLLRIYDPMEAVGLLASSLRWCIDEVGMVGEILDKKVLGIKSLDDCYSLQESEIRRAVRLGMKVNTDFVSHRQRIASPHLVNFIQELPVHEQPRAISTIRFLSMPSNFKTYRQHCNQFQDRTSQAACSKVKDVFTQEQRSKKMFFS